MPTLYIHRLLIIAPVAQVPTLYNFFATQAVNATDPDLGPGLNATGLASDPVTYNWVFMPLVDNFAWSAMNEICILSSVVALTHPQWLANTQAQNIAWAASVHDAILASASGIYVRLADNTGDWGDPFADLTSMGLLPATG